MDMDYILLSIAKVRKGIFKVLYAERTNLKPSVNMGILLENGSYILGFKDYDNFLHLKNDNVEFQLKEILGLGETPFIVYPSKIY